MADRKQKPDDIALDQFQEIPADQGLSLDELSESFARLLGEGQVPYDAQTNQRAAGVDAADADEPPAGPAAYAGRQPTEASPADDCPVSPENIIEAILFVGHPDDEPISSRNIASLMRGVRAAEVESMIAGLNQGYLEHNCPYSIESVGKGFRMLLRPEFHQVRERFYGRIREAQLTQAAINTLAIVAYNQPLEKRRIVAISGEENTGRVLSQLVRRGLLSAERGGALVPDDDDQAARQTESKKSRSKRDKSSAILYQTTDRFLDLFGLESLADLPQNHDLTES